MARKSAIAYLFLDANMFIQFAYQNVDWLTVSNYRQVIIVLAPKVIEEIDKHKTDSNSERKKERARGFSTFLRNLPFTSEMFTVALPMKDGVMIRILTNSPKPEEFPDLTWTSSDDQILASVLSFIRDNANIDSDVFIVSDDTSMRFKAMARKVNYLWNEHIEKHRLADEQSPEKKQLKVLEKKLTEIEEKLSARQPRLALQLTNLNDENVSSVVLNKPKILSNEAISGIIDREKSYFEQLSKNETEDVDYLMRNYMYNNMSRDLSRYYNDMRSYLNKLNIYRHMQARTIEVKILLENSIVPATDISVVLETESGILRFAADLIEKPIEPRRPTPSLLSGISLLSPKSYIGGDIGSVLDVDFIVEDNQIEWGINKLLHNYAAKSRYFLIWVEDDTEKILVNYQIHASNLTEYIQGELEIFISTKEE